jgi:transcriptional regulator with XRE-family HTH domain
VARKLDKQKAIKLRQKGLSYSQIKERLNIGKGTLSEWLSGMPLSEKRIKELRDFSPQRIERYRNTMKKKKDTRLKEVYKKVSSDIGVFSKREIFLLGLFLYWGEGTKTANYSTQLTNTNPAMLKFFIKWLELLGVKKKDLKVKLHLYSDMNISESIIFWSKELKIPVNQFKKPYIKETKLKSITYKNGFGKGTCCVIFENRDLWEYIIMGLKYISEKGIN